MKPRCPNWVSGLYPFCRDPRGAVSQSDLGHDYRSQAHKQVTDRFSFDVGE